MSLYKRFQGALLWNAFSFSAYKILFIAQTISLYKVMEPKLFSVWATTNSILYLMLLWSDFGLKKSIPRFMPIFSRSYSAHTRFIGIAITLKFISICLALLPTAWYLTYYAPIPTPILWRALLFFMLQGFLSIIEVIYHAHFWNKQFNLPTTIITGAGIGAVCTLSGIMNAEHLLPTIFNISIITTCINGMVTGWYLTKLIKRSNPALSLPLTHTRQKIIMLACIKHTAVMGATTILQSLTERNFLLPFFTYTLGIEAGNIFKVSNDMALFVYRSVIKTLGTADTALLSHIHEREGTNISLENASKKLITQIAALLFPVLGITIFFVYVFQDQTASFVFQLFIIMVLGYSLETLCIPYERVLEVYRQYRYIAYAYVPYVLGSLTVSFLIFHGYVHSLLVILACVHGVRLVSGYRMVWYARTRYPLAIPWLRILYVILLTGMGLALMRMTLFLYQRYI